MKKRLEYLELLRFILAFSVVVYHYFYIGPLEKLVADTPSDPALRYLLFAVDAFFVISGFVIMFSANANTIGEFVVARLARLGPALLVCGTLTFAVLSFAPLESLPVKLIQFVRTIFVVPLALGSGVDGSMWSLKYEIIFYTLVLFWIRWGMTPERLLILVALLIASDLVTLLLLQMNINLKWSPTVHYGAYFSIGILFYLHHHHQRSLWLFWCAAILTASIDAGIELTRVEAGILHHASPMWWESPVIAFAIAALVFAFLRGTSTPQLSRALRVLGMASYPLYLIHQDLGYRTIAALQQYTAMDVRAARWLTILIVVIFSIVFALLIEPPLMRIYRLRGYTLIKKFHERRQIA